MHLRASFLIMSVVRLEVYELSFPLRNSDFLALINSLILFLSLNKLKSSLFHTA